MFRTTNIFEISKIKVSLILKIESRKSKSVRVDNKLNNIQMKKVFLVLMTIVAISSCTKDDVSHQSELNLVTSLDNNKSSSSNPFEYVGQLHNIALAQAIEGNTISYTDIVSHLSELMNESPSSFATLEVLDLDLDVIVDNGHEYYRNLWAPGYIERDEKAYLNEVESILLADFENEQFVDEMDQVAIQVLDDDQINAHGKEILLGTISLAKHSYLFWKEHDGANRAKGKFWADIGGFFGGFVGSLTYNNNNGGGTDVNPFSTGVSIGTAASALADKDEEGEN